MWPALLDQAQLTAPFNGELVEEAIEDLRAAGDDRPIVEAAIPPAPEARRTVGEAEELLHLTRCNDGGKLTGGEVAALPSGLRHHIDEGGLTAFLKVVDERPVEWGDIVVAQDRRRRVYGMEAPHMIEHLRTLVVRQTELIHVHRGGREAAPLYDGIRPVRLFIDCQASH